MFKMAYKAIKDITMALPEVIDVNLPSIIIPMLDRVKGYLGFHSPSLPMLKFLDIVLKDFLDFPREIYDFISLYNALVPHISCCVYDDIYPIYNILLELVGYSLSPESILETL